MPAHGRSLLVTDQYRNRLRRLRAQAMTVARNRWADITADDLDRSHAAWVATTAAVLTELQRGGQRLSAAYLAAFITSETGQALSPTVPPVAVGVARDGRPLAEALVPSVFTVKQAIGDGVEVPAALTMGLNRAVRLVGEESVAPAREALAESIRAEDRIVGWRRVTGGGCGACLAAATGAIQEDDEVLEVHPFCSCTKEPVVSGVDDAVQRPTGPEIFEGMAAQEQDQLLGPDKAELVRSGDVPLHALIQHDPMAVVEDGITETPLEAFQHQS